MARLIDADKLLEAIPNSGLIWETLTGIDVIEVLAVKKLVDNAPTIEPFEKIGAICNENCGGYRPKGKWIIHNDYNESCRYGCDQCGNLTNRNSRFCPDCGADMRGDV